MTPHPYAEILRAIADGKQIQMQAPTGEWIDVQNYLVLGNAAHGPHEADRFRVKPEPRIGRYRVAEMRNDPFGWKYTRTADDEGSAKDYEQHRQFVRWLTDWIEYEVSE